MSCKYDIIDEDGRKRVRALRPFTVQGRDVCPMELGGYVYDANTLSQDGNCWIFSGSLEYPGVRVLDEAIVDMGNNLRKTGTARPKNVIISGNSRIMGAISFEGLSFDTAQTPAMFEQGGYTVVVGSSPVKNTTNRVRTPIQLFAGTVGKVTITSTAYEARLTSLNESGIITSETAWTVGGPTIALSASAPYILVEIRKIGETAITPADVTAAGVTVTSARESELTLFNSSLIPVYNGVLGSVNNVLRFLLRGVIESPTKLAIQNSYIRVECGFNSTNTFSLNADFMKVNYHLVLTPNVSHFIVGTYRNTNINTPASVSAPVAGKGLFDVSDCPNFEYSTATFPDLNAMQGSGKTFYFKQCNMPVGSAIHYYDPKVNVWDNIDFTKVEPNHLGEALSTEPNTILVSSNVQGMFRLYRNAADKVFGPLVEHLESVYDWEYGALESSYDSVIYKDCTISGKFDLFGYNVFGGTLGGKSTVTNTGADILDINGNFRIEGNAHVTDTALKGTGYIGDNAELKNGNVEGHIYLDGNAKYIPEKVNSVITLREVIMRDNAQYLINRDEVKVISFRMYDNSVINGSIQVASGGTILIMRDNAKIVRALDSSALICRGTVEMKDNASITGTGAITAFGDVKLVGGFNLNKGSRNIYGKHVIASPDDINRSELPPTKTTW